MESEPLAGRAATKQRQERTIRHAAMKLFLEHGFDSVTTTQVATAAGVSPATVFNYFATKEDLFFGQVDQLEADLVRLVRSCRPGESMMRALRGHVVYELTAGRAYTAPADVAPFHHQVAGSQHLQNREAEIYQRREAVLVEALTEALDCRSDPAPARIAAALYIAAERLIAAELRQRLSRKRSRRTLAEIDPFIDQVFAALSEGIGELPVPTSTED